MPVGLLVLNDTSGKESAPPLSPEALQALTVQVSTRVEKQYPVQVVKVLKESPMSNGPKPQLSRIGQEAGVDYLMVAILSSNEIEAPDRLPLQGVNQGGGGRGVLVGYRAENFSLAEIALVQVKTDVALFQGSGQGYATLARLAVPLESNVYPVIHVAERQAPIFPEESYAHDTLRTMSAENAIEQALFHMKKWPIPQPLS